MKEATNQTVEKLVEMVKGVRSCMFITHEKNTENLSGRPMGISRVDADGTMWFFTKTSSMKVDELTNEAKASVAIIDENHNNYLMIGGTVALVHNKMTMNSLWNPLMKTWFPEGIDDPDMVLLKMTPHEAHYWDSSSSKMVVLFHMLKAIVTGKEYDEGEHGTIKL